MYNYAEYSFEYSIYHMKGISYSNYTNCEHKYH